MEQLTSMQKRTIYTAHINSLKIMIKIGVNHVIKYHFNTI